MPKRRKSGEGTIKKVIKNGVVSYTGQVSLGYDDNGKRIRKTFTTPYEKETLMKMREALSLADKGIVVMNENTKLQEVFKMWIDTEKLDMVSSATYEKYDADYRLRILDSPLGIMSLKSIKHSHIQRFIKELSTTSINIASMTLTRLRSCFNYAIEEKYIYLNPANDVKLPTQREETKHYEYFEVEEQEIFLSSLNIENVLEFLFMFLLATGLRIGEAKALTWNDIDFKKSVVKINKQYCKQTIFENGLKTYVFVIGPPKTTAGYRDVPIPDNIVKALAIYKTWLLGQFKDNFNARKLNLVFPNKNGDYIESKQPGRYLNKLCKKIGIPKKQVHSTRHTYATRLFEAGVHPKVVQKLMGHKDIESTLEIYTRVSENLKAKEVDKINDVFHSANRSANEVVNGSIF